MHTYNLPKKYLSYSALSLWLQSPEQYRRRYYENVESYTSPEMHFGKHIADLLEQNHPTVAHIRRHKKPEQILKTTIEGVPILGFIDSFDPDNHQVMEYKTGRTPWSQERVDSHKQLDLYSLAVKQIFGNVNDVCHLIWLETEVCEPQTRGLIRFEDSHKLRLTGRVEEFERTITNDDRDAMRELLVKVATEISDDYTSWLSRNESSAI